MYLSVAMQLCMAANTASMCETRITYLFVDLFECHFRVAIGFTLQTHFLYGVAGLDKDFFILLLSAFDETIGKPAAIRCGERQALQVIS